MQTAQTPPPSVVDAPRSSRGNPPFYEVFGKRYYVLDSSTGYSETGVASWYGRDFHGQPTSGGETYNMHGLTAAHKTLPIPTWVEVRNLTNGKRVIVKVNDRGPFVGNRIIDLSMRAAEELDMVRAGTARVEVRALGSPAAAPDTRVAAVSPAPRSFGFISDAVADEPGPDDLPFRQMYMQVGAFSQHRNAAKLEATLKNNGFTDSFIVSGLSPQDSLHRVRIGPLQSADQFDRVNDGLRALGLDAGRLVTDN
jgi:rare lipoprotein A